MRKTVVFDFDKTLTYKDSMRELFLKEMVGCKYPLRIFYLLLSIFAKIGFISVKREKEIMISIAFRSNSSVFVEKCIQEAHSIKLTPIFEEVKKAIYNGDRVIILSATSVFILNEIFKDIPVLIIGTTFMINNNIISGIDQHPSKDEKYSILINKDVKLIDEMYYDSSWDECLIPLCKKWNRVKNGVIVMSVERSVVN